MNGEHQFYTQNVQFTSDPCDVIATWLYHEYEVLAVDSDEKPIAIIYGCGNDAKFADDSTRKYSSCDVTGYWSPPIEECQGKFINCIYRAYFITIMLTKFKNLKLSIDVVITYRDNKDTGGKCSKSTQRYTELACLGNQLVNSGTP